MLTSRRGVGLRVHMWRNARAADAGMLYYVLKRGNREMRLLGKPPISRPWSGCWTSCSSERVSASSPTADNDSRLRVPTHMCTRRHHAKRSRAVEMRETARGWQPNQPVIEAHLFSNGTGSNTMTVSSGIETTTVAPSGLDAQGVNLMPRCLRPWL